MITRYSLGVSYSPLCGSKQFFELAYATMYSAALVTSGKTACFSFTCANRVFVS